MRSFLRHVWALPQETVETTLTENKVPLSHNPLVNRGKLAQCTWPTSKTATATRTKEFDIGDPSFLLIAARCATYDMLSGELFPPIGDPQTSMVTREHFVELGHSQPPSPPSPLSLSPSSPLPSSTFFRGATPLHRAICPDTVGRYLATLSSPSSRAFATQWLGRVRYVPSDQLFRALVESVSKAIKAIGPSAWCILMDGRKYGSEHWLVQELFRQYVPFRDTPPLVCYNLEHASAHGIRHLLIMDDAAYSGGNVFGVLDEKAYCKGMRAEQKNQHTNLGEYHIHIAIPYVSDLARETIQSLASGNPYGRPGYGAVYFYTWNGTFEPSFLVEHDEKFFIRTRSDDDKNGDDEDDSAAGGGEWRLRHEVALECQLDPYSALVPLYFDHKIASDRSTAATILNKVVFPPPTREPIRSAETAWRNLVLS